MTTTATTCETWAESYEALAALAPDLDTNRLTDARLAEIGVTREEARRFAVWLGRTVEEIRDPIGDEAEIREFVLHVDRLNQRAEAGEDLTGWDAADV